GHPTLVRAERRDVDRAVEDDLAAWRERPEVAELVDATHVVAAHFEGRAISEFDALALAQVHDLEVPLDGQLEIVPVRRRPERIGRLRQHLAAADRRREIVRPAFVREAFLHADRDGRAEEDHGVAHQPERTALRTDQYAQTAGSHGGTPHGRTLQGGRLRQIGRRGNRVVRPAHRIHLPVPLDVGRRPAVENPLQRTARARGRRCRQHQRGQPAGASNAHHARPAWCCIERPDRCRSRTAPPVRLRGQGVTHQWAAIYWNVAYLRDLRQAWLVT